MTSSNLKFKPVYGSRLFYNHWHYCLRANLLEASCLRNSNYDPGIIDEILDQRQVWRAAMQKRWGKEGLPRKAITQQVRQNLHDFAAVLEQAEQPFKMVVSTSNLWIYTNHDDLLKTLEALPYLNYKRFTQAIIDRPPNTILLKNPRHKSRLYMRGVKMTDLEKDRLKAFLANYADIRLSPGLTDWLNNPTFHRSSDQHFVDYDSEGWPLLLSLVRPGIIRKTVQIMAK